MPDHEPSDYEIRWHERHGSAKAGTVSGSYPYEQHNVSEISDLIRSYIDRPKEQLLEPFENDRWGLTEILRAADRRIGKQRLQAMQTGNPAAQKIIAYRLKQNE